MRIFYIVNIIATYMIFAANQGHHCRQALIDAGSRHMLLCGGAKRTQQTDIAKACDDWRDWLARYSEPEDIPRNT